MRGADAHRAVGKPRGQRIAIGVGDGKHGLDARAGWQVRAIRTAISPRLAIRMRRMLKPAPAHRSCSSVSPYSTRLPSRARISAHHAARAGAHRVHQLHHFDDADDGVRLDARADFDERRLRRAWARDRTCRATARAPRSGAGSATEAASHGAWPPPRRRRVADAAATGCRRRWHRAGGRAATAPQVKLQAVDLELQLVEARVLEQPRDLRDIRAPSGSSASSEDRHDMGQRIRGRARRRRAPPSPTTRFRAGSAAAADRAVAASTAHSMSCAQP